MMEFKNVSASYGSITALDGIDLSITEGFIVILGPNGSGKTTLFRVGSGILPPDEGTVLIRGTDPHSDPSIKRQIGYLPHRPVLNQKLTVERNLSLWGEILGMESDVIAERTAHLAEKVGFEEFLDRIAGRLSRGQMQRAVIGQALLSDPDVLFLDEATSGLDPLAARDLRQFLNDLSVDTILVYSTHNLYEASELAEEVVLMNDGHVLLHESMDWVEREVLGSTRIGIKTRDSGVREALSTRGYTPERVGSYWVVEPRDGTDQGDLARDLIDDGINVTEIQMMDNELETLFERTDTAHA